MTHEFKPAVDPLRSTTGLSKQQIGWVTKQNHHRMEAVYRMVRPPTAQLALNGTRLNPSQPIRHCQHWVAEVVDALKAEKILDLYDSSIQFRSVHGAQDPDRGLLSSAGVFETEYVQGFQNEAARQP